MTFLPRRIAVLVAVTAGIFGSLAAPAQLAAAGSIPAPVLTAPTNNTTTPLKDVVLKWQQVSGASQYQVQVSPNGEWTNNTVSLPGDGKTVATVFEMPISLPHASYYWRVRAHVGAAWGPYSSSHQFLRDWEQPFEILKAPTSEDPSIVWTPVRDASEYLVRFSVDPGFPSDASKTVSCMTNSTSFTPYKFDAKAEQASGGCFSEADLTDNTDYYWSVEPLDDSTATPIAADTVNDPNWDCATAQPECDADRFFSTPETFTFSAPAAGTPTLGSVTGLTTSWHTTSLTGTDCNTTTACPVTPTFSWDPVTGANYYVVHVYRDPALTNTYKRYDTAWTELTPRDSYFDAQAGHAYYWTVEAGTCSNSDTDPTCAKSGSGGGGGNASCPTGDGTSGPTITSGPGGMSVSPAGPDGPQSMQGGTSATVTLKGSNFEANPCITPTAGTVSGVTLVDSSTITFTYHSPSVGGSVTFTVTNTDGAQSSPSTALTVLPGENIVLYRAGGPSSFDKVSGSVPLASPANNATAHGRSVTFSWGDFQANGARGSYDARNYELQVSRTSGFSSTVLDKKDIDLTQYTNPAGGLADGSYYWRVAPIDESSNVLTWSAAHTFTVDATGPSVRLITKSGVGLRGPLKIHFSEAVDGVSSSTVHIVARGTGRAIAGRISATGDPKTFLFTPANPLITGETYLLSLSHSLVDSNGNQAVVAGGGVRTSLVAKDNSPGWHFGNAWHRMSASGARSGSVKVARAGHSASIVVVGSTARLYGCKAPNMGKIAITVAGHTTTVNEHQSFTRCGFVLWHKALPHGEQKIKVTVKKGHGNIDELAVH